MERSVAAAGGVRVDIAGDVAVAVLIGSACWVVRLLLLYLSDRSTSYCFREVVWSAMLSTQPPSLAVGEAPASPCRVDKAWAVEDGIGEGSDTSANWLLTAVIDGGCGWCSVRRAGPQCGGHLHELVNCDRWKPLQRSCLWDPFVQELAWHCR